jgi:hypothetical protein
VKEQATDVYFEAGSEVWSPSCYYATQGDTSICQAGDFVFYYDLSDPGIWVKNFFTKGYFNFRLQVCCPAASQVSYEVRFDLLLNCDTLVCNASDTLNPPQCNDCCWLPLSSRGGDILPGCPGCNISGSIVNSYKMRRITYGYEDADDDRIADGAGNMIMTALE